RAGGRHARPARAYSEAAEIGLSILPSCLTIHRGRERRFARGTGSTRLETRLTQPGSARMPFGPRGVVRLAFCGSRLGRFCGGPWECRPSGFGLLLTGLLAVLRSLLP